MYRAMAGGGGGGGWGSFPVKVIVQKRIVLPLLHDAPTHLPRTTFSLSSDPLWHTFPSPYSLLTSKLQNFRGGNNLTRLLLKGKGKQASSAIKALPASQQWGLAMAVPHPAHVSSPKHLPFILWMGPGPLYSPAAWPRPGRGGTGERIQPIIRTEGRRTPCFKVQTRPVSEQSTSKESPDQVQDSQEGQGSEGDLGSNPSSPSLSSAPHSWDWPSSLIKSQGYLPCRVLAHSLFINTEKAINQDSSWTRQ